jgi:hypothetical protein
LVVDGRVEDELSDDLAGAGVDDVDHIVRTRVCGWVVWRLWCCAWLGLGLVLRGTRYGGAHLLEVEDRWLP